MKRRSSAPPRLDYSDALHRMFRGAKLVRTNGKRAIFDISPGGPISDITAQRLIEHNLCRADDPGLLADRPQSWSFNVTIISDT